MGNQAAQVTVCASEFEGLTIERYAYTAGTVEPLPQHSHEEYQLSLSFDCDGEYIYRGERHDIPTHRLSVIHSGEPHAPSDASYLPKPASFVMAYIHPDKIQAVLAEMGRQQSTLPLFPTVLPRDNFLNQQLLTLSAAIEAQNSQLKREEAMLNFLSCWVGRYASNQHRKSRLYSDKKSVMRSLDYLHAYYAQNISLAQLANIAGLSRYHFCRLFRKEVGVSVSMYQTQLRIRQAKRLLLQGLSSSTIATTTGFYDQSHFGKHFKRQVGVTPAKYTGSQ